MTATPAPPTPYTCRTGRYPDNRPGRRHRVITADGICVRCGARGVTDASTTPTPPAPAATAPAAELTL